MGTSKDDRVFLLTRVVSVVVAPVVILAFLTLYIYPESSGERFAWAIKPDMMDLFIGAGYLGGAYFFFNVIFARRWHRVSSGFPGVAAFTLCMLLATFLNWDRFDIHHLPFQLWLAIYIVTPVLVPWVWLRNRATDPRKPETDDAVVPTAILLSTRVLALVTILSVVAIFIFPAFLIGIWPWTLTPLTARVVGGWFALVGVGELFISFENRWSAWRLTLESVSVWQFFLLVGCFIHPGDFKTGLLNWVTVAVSAYLLVAAGLYIAMEIRRRKAALVTRGVLGS